LVESDIYDAPDVTSLFILAHCQFLQLKLSVLPIFYANFAAADLMPEVYDIRSQHFFCLLVDGSSLLRINLDVCVSLELDFRLI
jgi:hypothetical protein